MKERIYTYLIIAILIGTIFSTITVCASNEDDQQNDVTNPGDDGPDLRVRVVTIEYPETDLVKIRVGIQNYNEGFSHDSSTIIADITFNGKTASKPAPGYYWPCKLWLPGMLIPRPGYPKTIEWTTPTPEKSHLYAISVKLNPKEQVQNEYLENNEKTFYVYIRGTESISQNIQANPLTMIKPIDNVNSLNNIKSKNLPIKINQKLPQITTINSIISNTNPLITPSTKHITQLPEQNQIRQQQSISKLPINIDNSLIKLN